MTKFFLLFLFTFPVIADHHVPDNIEAGTNAAATIRVHHKKNKVLYHFDYEQTDKINNRVDKRYTLGVRYRFMKNFKAGLYYSLRYGQRHDEDWISGPNPPHWIWIDTSKRSENFVGLELIPRFLVHFLPGTWVGETRVKIERNFFNDNNTVKLKPGLTYFWMGDSGPFMNLFAQAELYIPLNYGEETIYEKWFYLGALYHYSKIFKPGIFFSVYEKVWTQTEAFKTLKNDTYKNTEKGNLVGITLNFRIP
ncbi:MAG: hypothetical protein KC493_03010 [Bacteriovoracaceae bacterium]|nr:hypothetical protein [Bacteriovoracaceae bacterium]